MLTWKQKKIVNYLTEHETMTKKDAMGLIDDHYYNGAKHVGDVLSRMVKRGILIRIKPGLFKLGKLKNTIKSQVNPDQTTLF